MENYTNHGAFDALIKLATTIASVQINPRSCFRPFFLFLTNKRVGCAVGDVECADGAMRRFAETIRQLAIDREIKWGVLVDKVKCDEMYAETVTPNSISTPPHDFVMFACQSQTAAPTLLLGLERDHYNNFLNLGCTQTAIPLPWFTNLVPAPEGSRPDTGADISGGNDEMINSCDQGVSEVVMILNPGEVVGRPGQADDPALCSNRVNERMRILDMINKANSEWQSVSGNNQIAELTLDHLHEMPTSPVELNSGKQFKNRGRDIYFYREYGLQKYGPLCSLPTRSKHILLKSQSWSYTVKGNHVAKILGPDAESTFQRKILTRDDFGWHYEYRATVNEPGLFEIRNINEYSQIVDSYTVFDGKQKAEISLEEARSLATQLGHVDFMPIVSKALALNKKDKNILKLRKKELCMWMLDCAQHMGTLEHREHGAEWVGVFPKLPIKVFPCDNPEWIGFTHANLCGNSCNEYAHKGNPLYDKLMAKELNKLPQSKLEQIAKYLCRWLSEEMIIRRVLAVINHANPTTLANLQKVVDLTQNFDTQRCATITIKHYHNLLRLAAAQGCVLHTNQITQIL